MMAEQETFFSTDGRSVNGLTVFGRSVEADAAKSNSLDQPR